MRVHPQDATVQIAKLGGQAWVELDHGQTARRGVEEELHVEQAVARAELQHDPLGYGGHLLLRAPRLTLISLVPNVMPIAWTLGVMGLVGIDLSTGTAMIASSVIGLVVDDTIHYLVHYQRSYLGDARAAVRETTTAVGAPLLINNVVLVLGFWVGCFGSFKPTIYFSLLSGITMITALVCDLFVTPALLVLQGRRRGSAA
jgi:predicted RND superfamily exporter protein